MPSLTAVDLVYGTTFEVHFTTTRDLTEACDTAVLQLVHDSGSELSIRIERGHVSDVNLWDADQSIRQHLPPAHVTLGDRRVTCSIPLALIPDTKLHRTAEAALTVNGTPVQTRFPVVIRAATLATSSAP